MSHVDVSRVGPSALKANDLASLVHIILTMERLTQELPLQQHSKTPATWQQWLQHGTISGAPSFVPDSPVGGGGSQFICCDDERDREHNCFSRPAVKVVLHRVAGKSSRETAPGRERPSREWHRRNLRYDGLLHGSHHMVARSEKLASKPEGKLGIPFCSVHLGCAQRPRVLVLFVHSDVGNLRPLFFFSASLLCPCLIG